MNKDNLLSLKVSNYSEIFCSVHSSNTYIPASLQVVNYGMVWYSYSGGAPPVSGHIKSINGVAWEHIKSYNGVEQSHIKTALGVEG